VKALGVAHEQAEIEVWGTVVFVDAASEIASSQELQDGLSKVRDFVHHVDEVFSTYKSTSVISQLRRKEIDIDECADEVREVWNRCGVARDITQGAFDPWAVAGGFDPSGLVKGWAADRCCEILQAHGAQHIQINAAGDLSLRGGHFDGAEINPWTIGVVNPENTEEIVQVFNIMDGAIATSGTYERGAHIIDPHTRLIAIGAKSATVIGPDGAFADALATALMVDGRDGSVWFSHPELSEYSAWVIDRHENIAWSMGPLTPTV
jgi:thiamine biosynthesis lipoprotein